MDNKLGAIIIAGGKSSRMGSDKGMKLLNGKPLIGYALAAVLPICSDVIISTNNSEYEQFGFPLVADIHKEIGPLGGLHAALKASKHQYNLVVSCDAPFVSTEILKKMTTSGFESCAYLDAQDGIHPLIGYYSKEILMNIEFQVAKENYKMMDFLEAINCQLYRPSKALQKQYPNFAFNVNTPESFAEAEKILNGLSK